MKPIEVAQAFVGRINAHDVEELFALMSAEHLFVDALDFQVRGREAMRAAWRDYFAMVPDYSIVGQKLFVEADTVAIFGRAAGTYSRDGRLKPENRWDVPAAWLAVIRGGRVTEWRVIADNDPLRKIMAREAAEK